MRIINAGLDGTVMLSWNIPPALAHDIVQYVKTFSPDGEGWRDPKKTIGERIDGGTDPWGTARRAEAVKRRRAVYHGMAVCYSCHTAAASDACT